MPSRRQPTSAYSSSYAHMNKADRAAYMARSVPQYDTLPIQDQVQPIIPARHLPLQTSIAEADSLPEPLPISEPRPIAEPILAPSPVLAPAPRDFGHYSPNFGTDDQPFVDAITSIAKFFSDSLSTYCGWANY